MATNNLDTLRAFIRNQAGLTDTKPPQPGPGRVELNHAEAMQVADWLDELATWRSKQDPSQRDRPALPPVTCLGCGAMRGGGNSMAEQDPCPCGESAYIR